MWGYKLGLKYIEEMGTKIKGRAEGMTAGVSVGNHLRFCRDNRHYCLIKGEILVRFLGPNMSISLTCLRTRLNNSGSAPESTGEEIQA